MLGRDPTSVDTFEADCRYQESKHLWFRGSRLDIFSERQLSRPKDSFRPGLPLRATSFSQCSSIYWKYTHRAQRPLIFQYHASERSTFQRFQLWSITSFLAVTRCSRRRGPRCMPAGCCSDSQCPRAKRNSIGIKWADIARHLFQELPS